MVVGGTPSAYDNFSCLDKIIFRLDPESTYSGNRGGSCVELRAGLDAVRDSKNPDGPVLEFRPAALRVFLEALRTSSPGA
ncbi:MAG: DUF397 domain-containing protein [Saccharothrix sp.]|nr:DUF397 domain-containing protein [Saccharothrix sp.]